MWYCLDIQVRQIFWCWVLDMALGSAVSARLKDGIHGALRALGQKKLVCPGHPHPQRLGDCLAFVHVWKTISIAPAGCEKNICANHKDTRICTLARHGIFPMKEAVDIQEPDLAVIVLAERYAAVYLENVV